MASIAPTVPESASPTQPELDWYAVIDFLDGSKEEKDAMKQWMRENESKHLEILVTGKTGTGKSTLVNALVGRKVAKEGHNLCPETKSVGKYSVTTSEGFEVVVWDSPGLQDGTVNEEEYLTEMKEKCSNVDLVIYCIKVDAPRSALHERSEASNESDYSAILKLTRTLGLEMWSNAVFVLTFANRLETILKLKHRLNLESKFKARIEDWRKRIRTALSTAGVPQNVLDNIRIEPAGHVSKPNLPGWNFWLSILWFTFVGQATKKSQVALIKMNVHRFKAAKDATQEDFTKNESHQQPIIIDKALIAYGTGFTMAGVSATAATVGTGVGATIGGVVGSAGFGVGAVIGAAAGAAVGASVGAGIGILYYMYQKHKLQQHGLL